MNIPSVSQVERYLTNLSREERNPKKVKVKYFGLLKNYSASSHDMRADNDEEIKKLGYGEPYLIVFEEKNKSGKTATRQKKLILSTMRVGRGFGHDYRADRVDNTVLSYDTWNSLPEHCGVRDLGAFRLKDSNLISLGQAGEFFLLRPMIEGTEYYRDLERISKTGTLEEYDLPRAKALANYLVKIHSKKNTRLEDQELYTRKLRDTVGHGECIFGLADSYPLKDTDYLKDGELAEIEKICVDQRWKLRKNNNKSRLCQVHGDFHPWNILFTNSTRGNRTGFKLLDRSRGEWGEPADDVCGLSINYIFSSLLKYGELKEEFLSLYEEFVGTYISKTRDDAIFEAMPLFYTFRALVIASPVWYPGLPSETRRKIFNFAENILEKGRVDPARINEYFAR